MITNGFLHYTIIKHIVDKGFAPDVDALSENLKTGTTEIERGLYALQEYHGIVLQPKEPKIWVIHLFP